MGCHTWCYNKAFDLNCMFPDETISIVLQNIFIKYDILADIAKEKEWIKDHKDKALYFKRLKSFWDRGWFRNDKPKRKLLDIIANNTLEVLPYTFKVGVAWKPVEEYGNNLFRVAGYPEDVMLSYEDTMKFLDKYYDPKNVYRGGVRNDALIKEFWEKYPNGMICVG